MSDESKSFIEDALHYASRETRNYIVDSLACHLHNEGYALEGNTEANDVEWFARNLYDRRYENPRWDATSDEVKDRYRQTARAVVAVLPDFQLRIAHRLIALSKVVREIERAERRQREAARAPAVSLPGDERSGSAPSRSPGTRRNADARAAVSLPGDRQ